MAKQKDRGDILEIFFDEKRDSLRKFQKIIRKVIVSERKNILVQMAQAPLLPGDYLTSLVFGAKALKAHGRTVTFVLSTANHDILKNSEYADYFILKIAQSEQPEQDEVSPVPTASKPAAIKSSSMASQYPNFQIQESLVLVKEEGAEEIPEKLPQVLRVLQSRGYSALQVDLTQLFFITPEVIQTLILETLNTGNALQIRISEIQEEVLRSNPQAAVLNLLIVEDSDGDMVGNEDVAEAPALLDDDEEAFGLDFDEEDVDEPLVSEDPPQILQDIVSPDLGLSGDVPSVEVPDDGTASAFKIEVNCLRAGEMTMSAFLRDFSEYFQKLFDCGQQLYIDLTDYQRLQPEIALRLLMANFEALAKQRKLGLRLLKDQHELMREFIPKLEITKKREDTTPRFIIEGSRMEVHHVPPEMFVEKFPDYFRQLMLSGLSKLVIDISYLHEFSPSAVDLMVLSYLEATGRGTSLTLRIRPEMEEMFLKSGRGKALPLEVVRPEYSKRPGIAKKRHGPGIDMSKIKDAMEKDRMGEKVLHKKYESVHIESRGTFENWEPAPVHSGDKIEQYDGPERRVEKRYAAKGLEVIFARGSIAKIGGRRYPLNNISQNGLSMICAVSLTKSENLRMKIFGETASVEVSAKVIWVKPVPSQALFRVGVQFTKMGEVAKTQISKIIGKLYRKG